MACFSDDYFRCARRMAHSDQKRTEKLAALVLAPPRSLFWPPRATAASAPAKGRNAAHERPHKTNKREIAIFATVAPRRDWCDLPLGVCYLAISVSFQFFLNIKTKFSKIRKIMHNYYIFEVLGSNSSPGYQKNRCMPILSFGAHHFVG